MDFEYQGQISTLATTSFRGSIDKYRAYEITVGKKSRVIWRDELLEGIEKGDFDGVSGKVISLTKEQLSGMEIA